MQTLTLFTRRTPFCSWSQCFKPAAADPEGSRSCSLVRVWSRRHSSLNSVRANIQVWWQDEGAWFTGSVASYDTNSRKHVVDYDDGDEEELDMAQEKYEILPGENKAQQLPI